MIKKLLIAPITAYTMLSMSVMPALAHEAQAATSTNGTTTPPGLEKKEEKRKEREERKENRQVNLACMQAAVEKRDNALLAAVDKRYSEHKTALTARRDALKAAWGITDPEKRKEALRAAWKAYREALEKTIKSFREAKRAAWKQFKEDRRACKAEGSSEDKVNEGTDSHL